MALFVYFSIHYVKTVKWPDFNGHVQLSQWPSSNTPDCGAGGPGFKIIRV